MPERMNRKVVRQILGLPFCEKFPYLGVLLIDAAHCVIFIPRAHSYSKYHDPTLYLFNLSSSHWIPNPGSSLGRKYPFQSQGFLENGV